MPLDVSHRCSTLCDTGSNCPKSCPIVIDFGFNVLKMTFSLSVWPLLFKRVIVSARTCNTFVFPANGSPTSMNLVHKKVHANVENALSLKHCLIVNKFKKQTLRQHTHVLQSSSHTFGSFYLRKTLLAVHCEFCSIHQQLLKTTTIQKIKIDVKHTYFMLAKSFNTKYTNMQIYLTL